MNVSCQLVHFVNNSHNFRKKNMRMCVCACVRVCVWWGWVYQKESAIVQRKAKAGLHNETESAAYIFVFAEPKVLP